MSTLAGAASTTSHTIHCPGCVRDLPRTVMHFPRARLATTRREGVFCSACLRQRKTSYERRRRQGEAYARMRVADIASHREGRARRRRAALDPIPALFARFFGNWSLGMEFWRAWAEARDYLVPAIAASRLEMKTRKEN